MPAPTAPPTFRPMRPADVPAVLPLLRQLWPTSPATDAALTAALHAGLASPGRAFFVAELAGRVVGLATLGLATDLWQTAWNGVHLDEFVIDEPSRGQGLGAAFLDFVLHDAAERGKTVLELTSAAHRTAAHRFYLRERFVRRETHIYARELD